MEIKWLEESEVEGSLAEFVKKLDAGTLDGAEDAKLFYGAIAEATVRSGESDDEDKQELAEVINDDIEEYESLAYFTEVRGHPVKVVTLLKEGESKFGTWTGDYEPLPDIKQNIFMEMTPACSLKILKGNPNTDSEFFAGDLIVKGPLKLATKPRAWIEAFYEYIEREPED